MTLLKSVKVIVWLENFGKNMVWLEKFECFKMYFIR